MNNNGDDIMNKFFSHRQPSGFSLIEVLIGIAIAGVGIIGVTQLQKLYMQSSSQATNRVVAMQLIREQLDNAKIQDQFVNLMSGSDAAPIVDRNRRYTRDWVVINRYYVNGQWQDGSNGLNPVPNTVDAKRVTVTISWTDNKGEQQTLSQSELVSGVSLHDSTNATNVNTAIVKPKIPYTPIGSLESPPITLFDKDIQQPGLQYSSKETSKPIPTISKKGNYHRINFEAVTFNHAKTTQTLEDFSTVNCSCSFAGIGDAPTPAMLTIEGDSLINDVLSGQLINKTIGTNDATKNSDFLCTKCCDGHHDTNIVARYTGAGSSNHPHFLDVNQAPVNSGNYLEACRFKRIDGFYRLVPDWLLVDVIVMTQDFFNNPDNSEKYVDYVKYVVKAYVLGQALDPLKKPSRDVSSMPVGDKQLIARGIYVDIASLATDDIKTIKSQINSNGKWLTLVPFYDINLTQFATWTSSKPSLASVSNQPIQTDLNASVGYYGTYSRGRLSSSQDGTTTITAQINTDNTGITGSASIIKQVANKTYLTNSINITVNSNPPAGPKGKYSVRVDVACLSQKGSAKNVSTLACKAQDTANVNVDAITSITSSVSCQYSAQSGKNTAFVSCNNIPQGWIGSIRLSKAGYTFSSSAFNFTSDRFNFGSGGGQHDFNIQATPTFNVSMQDF